MNDLQSTIERSSRTPVCGTKAGVRAHVDVMTQVAFAQACRLMAEADTTMEGLVELIWRARRKKHSAGAGRRG